MGPTPEDIQRSYYASTATAYDAMHVSEEDQHSWGLARLVDLIRDVQACTVLDVGTGTGRALKAITERCPSVQVHGVEPVRELIDLAVERHGIPAEAISVGSGDALPFPDDSFDIVCEFAVLHHVPDPAKVVREMLRVARRGIVISDSNRFGQGGLAARWIKLALARAHLWQIAYRAIHQGKPYNISEGDGLAYSYSVYDNLNEIAAWSERVQLLAPGPAMAGWCHPLLTSPHVVLVAERDHRTIIPASDSGEKPK